MVAPVERKKGWRQIIKIFIPLLIISILVTAEAIISESPQFRYSEWYNTTLTLFIINSNILLILILVIVIVRHLVKLLAERKARKLGSHFRTKLVLTMTAVILIPTVLVFIISSDLISKSIDRWYEDTVERIVITSADLSQQYLDDYVDLLERQASNTSEYIENTPDYWNSRGELRDDKVEFLRNFRLLDQLAYNQFDVLEVYKGMELFDQTIVNPDSVVLPYIQPPEPTQLRTILQMKSTDEEQIITYTNNYPSGALFCALAPIFPPHQDGESVNAVGVVMTGFGLDANLAALSSNVSEDYALYREQVDNRHVVKLASQTLLLVFTLISLFSAIWSGIYFSRSITVPIEQLAEGTRAVASGNLEFRIEAHSADELGMLINSFNSMTSDLKHSKTELEAANKNLLESYTELDQRRNYTETLLSNLTSAVISLNSEGRVATINASALKIFDLREEDVLGRSWQRVFSSDTLLPLGRLIEQFLGENQHSVIENINLRVGQDLAHLTATVTSLQLQDSDQQSTLIVLDDLTKLVRAQRTAAWREVAQRIAHEIKNPLTPIQLSAERIRRKVLFADEADGNGNVDAQLDLISSCTETIIEETGTLKSMVNAFSTFASMPQVKLVPDEITRILEKATAIYTTESGFKIIKNYEDNMPQVELDPDQLKMAFVNIINNAIEAIESEGTVTINCWNDKDKDEVVVDFADNGPGISPESKDRLFIPYFSTKNKGTGLGLAIVNRIIQEHHGSISVSDNEPKGACFSIRIPTL